MGSIRKKNEKKSIPFCSKNKKQGFTIIELLVYLGILSVISVVALGSLFSSMEDYARLKATQNAIASGRTAMLRMVYEIRHAEKVDIAGSNFTSNPDVLVLNSGDDDVTGPGNEYTIKFEVQNETLQIFKDGSLLGVLTKANAQVLTLDFSALETSNAQAVKINMTVQGVSRRQSVLKEFQDTIVLRNKEE